MTDEAMQQIAQRGPVRDGLERAERTKFTEPVPTSPTEQVRFLVEKVKVGTRALAARLGVSQRTVQRYIKGTIRKPRQATREALADQAASEWQPEVRAQVRERASSTTGLLISVRCRFGFDAPGGSSDEARMRRITQRVSPAAAREIIAGLEAGVPEKDLHDLVAHALGEAYFQDGGSRAAGLTVRMRDIDYIDFRY
ncbi:helix-turn-helix transcriptional regulator [Streptomyces sp. NPDC013178]|uniref:telomere-protecting terminal protein Tpg n=1 Tax=Streptomyces sp. NPDC013178 TaxID=3155118 RepID=UPI00340CF60B